MEIHVRVIIFVYVEHETGRPGETGLNQRPTTADPVAVASIDQLICAATKSALWSILPGREPRDEPGDVEGAIIRN